MLIVFYLFAILPIALELFFIIIHFSISVNHLIVLANVFTGLGFLDAFVTILPFLFF